MSKPRIGPRMHELQSIVSALPGCSKSEALRRAGLATHGPGSGRSINRTIAAGLIVVEKPKPNLTRLFLNERDAQRWHLRRELLQPGTPADRVAELREQLSDLDGQRAATWTD